MYFVFTSNKIFNLLNIKGYVIAKNNLLVEVTFKIRSNDKKSLAGKIFLCKIFSNNI